MPNDKSQKGTEFVFFSLFLSACLIFSAAGDEPNWQKEDVNWRVSGNGRIRVIQYPKDKPVLTLEKQKKQTTMHAAGLTAAQSPSVQAAGQLSAIIVNSPPIDGFVPWIVVLTTDKHNADEFVAAPTATITGNYTASDPETDYAIGIFDSGASINLLGYYSAETLGIFNHDPDIVTSNAIPISGVTGTVDASVTFPLGIFISGLSAIEPDERVTNTSGFVGETNVSIAVGQYPSGIPDLATAIGAPMSVYYTTSLRNDQPVTVSRGGESYTAPKITFYQQDDPCIPVYNNSIPLELRPLGGASVQYVAYDIDPETFEYIPSIPSTIVGNLSQSLFFVSSIDIFEGSESSIDKDRFMLDTGAQISVVGKRIAARLALDIYNPEFEVEIEGVNGDTIIAPGFYIDLIKIPTLGQRLSFTNVPVVLLDVFSPEGGTLDGIIGMNMFTDFNLLLRGGGLFLQDDPALDFEYLGQSIVGDIAPSGGDGTVNYLDLEAFMRAWQATSSPVSDNWNPLCDFAPQTGRDGVIDFLDFAVFAQHWFENVTL